VAGPRIDLGVVSVGNGFQLPSRGSLVPPSAPSINILWEDDRPWEMASPALGWPVPPIPGLSLLRSLCYCPYIVNIQHFQAPALGPGTGKIVENPEENTPG
jgi:hypothetical protein